MSTMTIQFVKFQLRGYKIRYCTRVSRNDFFQADVPFKKRTNQFDFTTMKPQVDLFWFIFWKKLKSLKRHFEIKPTFSYAKDCFEMKVTHK